MEYIKEAVDKKTIQKQDIGINSFLIENNLNQIEKIIEFFNSQTPLMLINGFMGTGKIMVVNQALSFLSEDVITLKYNCFETTILDDILLEFFDSFKRLTAQNVIQIPKARTENFTQKINAYFDSIKKPIVIVLFHLAKSGKVKIILIARKFDHDDFKIDYEKTSISALEKSIFEKYLKSEDFKQIGPLSDELYKYSRGYFFYTTLSIKIMQIRKLNLMDFLSGYTKSFLSFSRTLIIRTLSRLPINIPYKKNTTQNLNTI